MTLRPQSATESGCSSRTCSKTEMTAGRRPKRCTRVVLRPRPRSKRRSKISTRTKRRLDNREMVTEAEDTVAKTIEETIIEATMTETKARVIEEMVAKFNTERKVTMEEVALTATAEERPETTKKAEMTERAARETTPKKPKSSLLTMKRWVANSKRTLMPMP